MRSRRLLFGAALCQGLAANACEARNLDLFDRVDSVTGANSPPEPDQGANPEATRGDDGGVAPSEDGPGTRPRPGPVAPTSAPEPDSAPGGSTPPAPGVGGSSAAPALPDPVLPEPEPEPTTPSPPPTTEPDASTPEAPSVDAGVRPDFISIDDFEDDNLQGNASLGWWYATTDTTAGSFVLETVATDERPGSAFVLHVAGNDFTDWGVILGLDLRGSAGSFDATPTNAVRFTAKAASERVFILRLLEPTGGSYTTEVALTTEWLEFTVPFDDFVGVGDAGTVQSTALGHLHFYFGIEAFEAWIDDVAFVTL